MKIDYKFFFWALMILSIIDFVSFVYAIAVKPEMAYPLNLYLAFIVILLISIRRSKWTDHY